jgi:hypothetical protein
MFSQGSRMGSSCGTMHRVGLLPKTLHVIVPIHGTQKCLDRYRPNENFLKCHSRLPRCFLSCMPFVDFPIEGQILAGLLVLFSLLTLAVYIDEIVFIKKRFRRGTRTMWVLACYPVSSATQTLSVIELPLFAIDCLTVSCR